ARGRKPKAKGVNEAKRVGANACCLTGSCDTAQDQYGASLRVRDEEITIGCRMNDARHNESSRGRRVRLFLVFGPLHRSGCVPARIELDRKAGWSDWPRSLRPLNQSRAVGCRLRWPPRRQ